MSPVLPASRLEDSKECRNHSLPVFSRWKYIPSQYNINIENLTFSDQRDSRGFNVKLVRVVARKSTRSAAPQVRVGKYIACKDLHSPRVRRWRGEVQSAVRDFKSQSRRLP